MEMLNRTNIYRIMCITIVLAALFVAGLVIVRPFIPAIILALIFTVATWPVFLWLKKKFKNSATLAATIMTLGLSICFILPFVLFGHNLVGNFAQFNSGVIKFFQDNQGSPPEWLTRIPFIGAYIDKYWIDYINNTAYIAKTIKENVEFISQRLLNLGTTIGGGIVDVALGIFFSFFFFRHGKEGMQDLKILLDRFIGPRAERLLEVSKTVIVSIIYGLLGTALAQATVAGVGFWIADIPGSVFLALLVFLLSPVPIGPPLVWIPAVLWLFSQDEIGLGIFMFFWGLLGISAIDNVFRPYLISQGSRMPFLVVLLGVLGGVFTFGFIGFFIGPTILAIIYVLFREETRAANSGVKRVIQKENNHEPTAQSH